MWEHLIPVLAAMLGAATPLLLAGLGELVAERAKGVGVETVVFDRGGSRYAGRVAALADGARSAGLTL